MQEKIGNPRGIIRGPIVDICKLDVASAVEPQAKKFSFGSKKRRLNLTAEEKADIIGGT